MNKITLKSALFLMLFAAVFTSCEKEEDSDIPTITLSGDNPLVYETIGSEYVEPGVSVSEGTLIVDKTSLHMDRRGESTVYYSAIDGADNVGHASRKVIVRNPSEVIEGSYNVEILNSNGDVVDVYIDQITQDDYINGKYVMSNFTAPCQLDKVIYGQYDWNSQTLNIITGQTIDNMPVDNIGGNFPVDFSGNTTFQMEISVGGATSKYVYRKRSDPVPSSYIRIIHLSSNAGPIDFRVDNAVAAPSIPYGGNSDYLTTDAGTRSLKLTSAGSCSLLPMLTSPITNNTENANYSFFMLDDVPNLELLKLQDDLNPTPGQAKVRFVHGANLGTNVNVVDEDNGNAMLIDDVAFKGYKTKDINVGSYKLKLVDSSGNPIPGFNTIGLNVTLEDGKVYTLVSYIEDGTTNQVFKLIQDN